jgi:CubicO group peptidase (beta-lactamase class C family)
LLDESEVPINGLCAPGFERVRDAFESNFTDGDDVGAAGAVWVEGDLVVNLWGGFADAAGQRPWREDTLASIYSGTKGLTSTCIHLLADRGELDLHAPVAR